MLDIYGKDYIRDIKKEKVDNTKYLKEETEYQKYYNSKLEKWGISSVAELSAEKKKKFFAEVDKDWTGEKEVK